MAKDQKTGGIPKQIELQRANGQVAVFSGYGQELRFYFFPSEADGMETDSEPAVSVTPEDPIFGAKITGLFRRNQPIMSNVLIRQKDYAAPENIEMRVENLRMAMLFCYEFEQRKEELHEMAEAKVRECLSKNRN